MGSRHLPTRALRSADGLFGADLASLPACEGATDRNSPQVASASVGSITERTRAITLAGKPPICAFFRAPRTHRELSFEVWGGTVAQARFRATRASGHRPHHGMRRHLLPDIFAWAMRFRVGQQQKLSLHMRPGISVAPTRAPEALDRPCVVEGEMHAR